MLSRLGVRLAAATLVVGLLGGLVGGYVVRQSTRDAIESEAAALVVGLSDRLASDIDDRVNLLATGFRALSAGAEVAALGPAAELELAVSLKVYGNVTEFALYDRTGAVVAAAAKDRLVDLDRVAGVSTVLAGQQRTDLVRTDPTSIDITVAVENPPGTVIGALRGRVRLDTIVQGFDARLLGPAARAVYIDADGVILDHPERNRVLAGETYPTDELDGQDAVILRRSGRDVLAAAAPTSALAGTVIIEWDESEAFAVADREATLVGLVVALIVLGAVGVLLVLTRQLLQPLEGLRLVLRRIGEGDHGARAAEVGSREFRQVATDVNAMAEAVTTKIGELERAQAELAAAQAQFRAAFEQAPVAMAISTVQSGFTDVNPAMCELLRYSRDELLAVDGLAVTHPDFREATTAAARAAVTGAAPSFEMEKLHIRKDGKRIPTLTKVACVRSPEGELLYFIVHIIDLSELRAAEERFKRIVDSSPDVFVVIDDDRIIEVATGRVAEMLGHDPRQLVGQPVEVLVPQFGHAGEGVARRSDGREVPVEITLGPIELGGAATSELVTIRDLTERRAGEAAARELHDMRDRQRQAIEINDNIVQGLTIARWSFDLGEVDAAREAVQRTVETARLLVDRMLTLSGAVEPGSLRRGRALGSE